MDNNEQLLSSQRIADRKMSEDRLGQSTITFEGLRSNSGLLREKPDIQVENPREMDPLILSLGRAADIVVTQGLKTELAEKGLMPDGKTFYLIDFGLPHLPALQPVSPKRRLPNRLRQRHIARPQTSTPRGHRHLCR